MQLPSDARLLRDDQDGDIDASHGGDHQTGRKLHLLSIAERCATRSAMEALAD